ncbi:hypothetical protein [Rathayibacter sp. AY2B9]|uniref:hypothetical protein n=1 Tax=Rathayibacter sp. AY2B9 TaxID=2080572 RepID=UPI000CE8C3F2|nr:hypothetical protein [Rathayibacter sp. AY2B9]PPG34533.1 hypothetical protein C5C25_00485 [Rathayibacter sp. AY2B9]
MTRKRPLSSDEKHYISIYAWGALWVLVFVIVTPSAFSTAVDRTATIFFVSATILGALVAIWAIFRREHLPWELIGIGLLMIGPLTYGLLQLGLSIMPSANSTTGLDRLHLVFLSLWPVVFLFKRGRWLFSRMLRLIGGAKDEKA